MSSRVMNVRVAVTWRGGASRPAARSLARATHSAAGAGGNGGARGVAPGALRLRAARPWLQGSTQFARGLGPTGARGAGWAWQPARALAGLPETLSKLPDDDDDEDEEAEFEDGFDGEALLNEDEDGFDDGGLERVEVAAAGESDDDGSSLSDLGLSQVTIDALEKRGIKALFPIQEAVIKPALREGKDVMGRARTGSGKTIAFALPVIEGLLAEGAGGRGRRGRSPRCLVLAPTRELAKQVEVEFQATAPELKVLCCYGGVSIQGQERVLRQGTDVVVGTPGRVIDLMERGVLQTEDVRYAIMDEADQMLAVGFAEEVEKIMADIPERRQTFLFSATMPQWVHRLARDYLSDNRVIIDQVGDDRQTVSESVTTLSCCVSDAARRSVLADLVTVHAKGGKAIVFAQTKRETDEVAATLIRRLACEALHGDVAQLQRDKILKRFREGRFSVLVATDVAARGLDISDVDLVVHYELPQDTETFVHRSGRTGRAGRTGVAIAMHTDRESYILRRIARDANAKWKAIAPPSSKEVITASATQASLEITEVEDEVVPYFTDAAQTLIEKVGAEKAVAAALAALSGHHEKPAERSLMTGEEGVRTVHVERLTREGPFLESPRDVMRVLARVLDGADGVGKIAMVQGQEAAIFDITEENAVKLDELGEFRGARFGFATSPLPELVPNERDSRGGGRGRGRGGYRGRGG
eukprot:CAMPEP_0170134812 /NCGR_PEP_ID=MMETSP0033_2-20121228/2120_1 /TAXON_ID=195969 /ORGANISM="Dolichomastix tenuilepis, Strain CCMP3274" /LENGTH=700 /DNA_ID=CAMNT_0010370393 /DNA_START=122 /DNA_END=2220 /DNA_ORIENTATION=-